MTDSSRFQTATMAKLYADQGYLRKAAEIYRCLLRQDPARSDLQAALSTLEERISLQDSPNWKELGLLVNEWTTLLKQFNRRRKPVVRNEET